MEARTLDPEHEPAALAAQLADALVENYDNAILAAKTPTLQENLNAAELCPPGTGET
jgi:hypothetical protein